MGEVNVSKWAGSVLSNDVNKFSIQFSVVSWPQFGNLVIALYASTPSYYDFMACCLCSYMTQANTSVYNAVVCRTPFSSIWFGPILTLDKPSFPARF